MAIPQNRSNESRKRKYPLFFLLIGMMNASKETLISKIKLRSISISFSHPEIPGEFLQKFLFPVSAQKYGTVWHDHLISPDLFNILQIDEL